MEANNFHQQLQGEQPKLKLKQTQSISHTSTHKIYERKCMSDHKLIRQSSVQRFTQNDKELKAQYYLREREREYVLE